MREGAVGCHESLQHMRDHFHRLDVLADLGAERCGISLEARVERGGHRDGNPDRPIVGDGTQSQFRHAGAQR
jgi:hypothetical protein